MQDKKIRAVDVTLINKENLERYVDLFFRVLERTSDCGGYSESGQKEIFAKAFGYSAYIILVDNLSENNQLSNSAFIDEIYFMDMAERLGESIKGVCISTIYEALVTANAKYVSTHGLYQRISASPREILLSGSADAIASFLKEVDIADIDSDLKEEYLYLCSDYGFYEIVCGLLESGVEADKPFFGALYPMDRAIIKRNWKTQLALVKAGADINRSRVAGYQYSLPFLAIECEAFQLLNYCIDNGLLNYHEQYLEQAIRGKCIKTTAALYRIATRDDKVRALKKAIENANRYQVEVFYRLEAGIFDSIDCGSCLPFPGVHPSQLANFFHSEIVSKCLLEQADEVDLALCILACASDHGIGEKSSTVLLKEFLFKPGTQSYKALCEDKVLESIKRISSPFLLADLMLVLEINPEVKKTRKYVYDNLMKVEINETSMRLLDTLTKNQVSNEPLLKIVREIQWVYKLIGVIADRAQIRPTPYKVYYIEVAKRLARKAGFTKRQREGIESGFGNRMLGTSEYLGFRYQKVL